MCYISHQQFLSLPKKDENTSGISPFKIAGRCLAVFGVFIFLWTLFTPPDIPHGNTRTACMQPSCSTAVTR